MIDREVSKKEYLSLREEVNQRIKILHQTINLAILILVLFLIFISYLLISGLIDKDILLFLILWLPIIFSLLTFNYQANQMTMEAIARYSNKKAKKDKGKEAMWDDFYEEFKKINRLISFLKTMPLLLPQIVPIIYYGFIKNLSNMSILFWIDIFLFMICLINFRYKLIKME